jgi:bifunctional non-homologous end joining protein LigD
VKNHCSQEFVIGGYVPGEGARARLGALLVGVYERPGVGKGPHAPEEPGVGAPGGQAKPQRHDDRLVYAGKVGTGFTDAELTRLLRLLEARRRPDSPFSPPPPVKGAVFVEPELVAEVEFTEWTSAGILRHPSYKGLRDDKDPREVVREPMAPG